MGGETDKAREGEGCEEPASIGSFRRQTRHATPISGRAARRARPLAETPEPQKAQKARIDFQFIQDTS